MKNVLLLAIVLAMGLAGAAPATISIELVPVGDAGNVDDIGYGGAVAYEYNLGKYEITGAQYGAFLDAVASTDTYGLYNSLQSGPLAANIVQEGSPGSYTYSVGNPDRPVTGVDWLSAARFCNWMTNGQPTGAQDAGTTEDGAYDVSGGYGTAARKAGATWMLPTSDEWRKAAYYNPITAGMNMYPTSDIISWGDHFDWTTIGSTPPGGSDPRGYDNSYNQVGTAVDVGSYPGSLSPYGTHDQAGNVRELIEDTNSGSWRLAAGNDFRSMDYQRSFLGNCVDLNIELWQGESLDYIGFRVVNIVPEPMTLALLGLGSLVLGRRNRRA